MRLFLSRQRCSPSGPKNMNRWFGSSADGVIELDVFVAYAGLGGTVHSGRIDAPAIGTNLEGGRSGGRSGG